MFICNMLNEPVGDPARYLTPGAVMFPSNPGRQMAEPILEDDPSKRAGSARLELYKALDAQGGMSRTDAYSARPLSKCPILAALVSR